LARQIAATTSCKGCISQAFFYVGPARRKIPLIARMAAKRGPEMFLQTGKADSIGLGKNGAELSRNCPRINFSRKQG